MLLNLIKTEATFCKSAADSSTYKSVHKLKKLAGKKVDSMALPPCWEWKVHDVMDWLENDVKLPEYKSCMEVNFIDGRGLLLLESDKLIRMGIHNFSHIKTIMESIRRLFRVEKTKFKRSVCLPSKYPMTLYLEYRVPTGPIRESSAPTDFFEQIYILDNWKNYSDNHNIKFRVSKIPYIRFGLIKRRSVYTKIELAKQPQHINKKFINFLRN